ncbi:MAG: CoA transferase, partial [Steroidobacteraceae bacterium]
QLARLLHRSQWLSDARFADPDLRRRNGVAMQAELAAVLLSRDAAEWEGLLSGAGIPCGMVRDIGEAMTLPALDERGLRLPLQVPGLPHREDVSILGPGFLSSQGRTPSPGAPPRHGEHTAEILAWLAEPAAQR